MMRAPNTATKLVELSKAELVGSVDNDGVSIGDVDPSLYDGGTNEHVVSLVIKVGHDFLKRLFAQLAMRHPKRYIRYQLTEFSSRLLDGLHLIVKVGDLAPAQRFAQNGLLH